MAEVDESEQCDPSYAYCCEAEPFKQGAEARLYRCIYLGRPAILKKRFSKKYRHPVLDDVLTKERLKAELRAMCRCKMLGIDVPAVYFVDSERSIFIMERIKGELTARDFVEAARKLDNFEEVIRTFGQQLGLVIGKIHAEGVVHGDLTTSNILLRNNEPDHIVLIDFGLSERTATTESKGVDLFVLEKAINSTHINAEFLFESVLEGYKKQNAKQFSAVFKKLEEIRLRGRKREMVG